ncbi:lytic transglycosylase domain-containing protein [Neolewinella agarilytica]|uniref:lytic transglycosylase domain-containing protein n=1 Tax=Neolewinella agarilytica TaxID=478744 RepID=UPI0023543C16|nr:lytic transglycosylase domain-containing protein [Neolewinella agarilytica]
MRVYLLFFLAIYLTPALALGGTLFADWSPEEKADYIMESADSLVRARLALMDSTIMEHRLDPAIKRRIINYVEHWPIASGRLLARSARFFPIFEEQLLAAGMPLALKYVTVQESALRPWATSQVGAGGLWQLMPGTARELGLTVNEELDERLDPELGCAAGLDYLRIQYEKYEDWSLALAAYNCGPGNVNKALRRSRGTDYWSIRKHLPRETRNYIPNIIAAAYIMVFHHEHELVPGEMELDLQITEAITVDRKLSLHRVAQVTGLRPEVVIELNAQYLRGYLPGMPGGHRLRLPSRVMPAMRTYLSLHPAEEPESDFFPPWSTPSLENGELNADRFYGQYSTIPSVGDSTLRQVAEANRIPVDQLAVWSNRGELDSLGQWDQFFFYRVDKYRPYDPRKRNTPPASPQIMALAATPIQVPDKKPTENLPAIQLPANPQPQKASFADKVKSWF